MEKIYPIGANGFKLDAAFAQTYYTLFRDVGVDKAVEKLRYSYVELLTLPHVGLKTAKRIIIMLNELGVIELNSSSARYLIHDEDFRHMQDKFESFRI